MRSSIWLLRVVLAGAGLLFLGRLAFYFFQTGREAVAHSAFGYYDPTVFVVVGLLLLPALVLALRYAVQLIRRAGRR